jgi:hypothetical protein
MLPRPGRFVIPISPMAKTGVQEHPNICEEA